MSTLLSVSEAVSGSAVWKKTLVPPSEAPFKSRRAPLPPAGPVDSSVVVPPERS